jgi:hypothetical protein
MIRHQAVRVQGAAAGLQGVAQEREINHPVGTIAKAGAPVVPSLDHMESYAGKDQARKSRHSR